ncbi:MAG: hypothetical protein Q9191_005305 [Dirinaria sp. TL-2023a]
MYRKVRKTKGRPKSSSEPLSISSSAKDRSRKPTLGQRIKAIFHTKRPDVPSINAADEVDSALDQELTSKASEHRRRDHLIVHLMVQGSNSPEGGAVAALAQTTVRTTAMTTPSTQSATPEPSKLVPEQAVVRQRSGELESGIAVEDLAQVYDDEPGKSAESDISKISSREADSPKSTSPRVGAELNAEKRLRKDQRTQCKDGAIALHDASPSSRMSQAPIEIDLSQAIKDADPEMRERVDLPQSTPPKNASETTPHTPSPENVKRSQMVSNCSQSSTIKTLNENSKDIMGDSKLHDHGKQIENLKKAHEVEITALRQENENKLAALRRKLLKPEASKEHEQERVEKATGESQLIDKIATLESQAANLSQRYSDLEETMKSMKPKNKGKGKCKGKGKAKEKTRQPGIGSQTDENNASAALEQAMSERDAAQQNNIELRQNLEAANSKLQNCQREVTEFRTIAEVKHLKLADLRAETERSPNVTAETDELLRKQGEMHDLLVKEHNEVIGWNSKLRGELEDLKAEKDEEIDSLKIELSVIKSSEQDLIMSHDSFQHACNSMITRLRSKMTVGDVDEATKAQWELVNEDNKDLKERVSWLTLALKSSNKCRLESNNERRAMTRVYKAKIKENEDLLEFKTSAQVELDAIKLQMDFHTPGCTDIIADRDGKIAAPEQQLKDSAQRYEEQIRAGASEGALLLLQDKEDMANLRQQRLDALQQELDDWRYTCQVQGNQLAAEEACKQDFVYELEDWKARAISAEEEVDNLRKQLDDGDEQLADPRKWEHWRLCSEWKAHGKVVTEEYKAKEQKIEGIIGGLWQRMLDFEHQARQNSLPDPDDCLNEFRRADIAKSIKDIFHYNPDSHIRRRTEGDQEPEPADDVNSDSATSEEAEQYSESDFSDESNINSKDDDAPASESSSRLGFDAAVPPIAPCSSRSPEPHQQQHEGSGSVEPPYRKIGIEEDYDDSTSDIF